MMELVPIIGGAVVILIVVILLVWRNAVHEREVERHREMMKAFYGIYRAVLGEN